MPRKRWASDFLLISKAENQSGCRQKNYFAIRPSSTRLKACKYTWWQLAAVFSGRCSQNGFLSYDVRSPQTLISIFFRLYPKNLPKFPVLRSGFLMWSELIPGIHYYVSVQWSAIRQRKLHTKAKCRDEFIMLKGMCLYIISKFHCNMYYKNI